MATFLLDRKAVTLTIHKDHCSEVPEGASGMCACSDPTKPSDQVWFCEVHFNHLEEYRFFQKRFSAVIFCKKCF